MLRGAAGARGLASKATRAAKKRRRNDGAQRLQREQQQRREQVAGPAGLRQQRLAAANEERRLADRAARLAREARNPEPSRQRAIWPDGGTIMPSSKARAPRRIQTKQRVPPEGVNALALMEGSAKLWAKTASRLEDAGNLSAKDYEAAYAQAVAARNLAITSKCECRVLMADAACTAGAKMIYSDLLNRADLIHARINESLGEVPRRRASSSSRMAVRALSAGALVSATIAALAFIL
ncbi:Hypothetical Protein FCC1311_082612 [Hondaea fermentalgiana]|uniref:Uncharacterized protein n=1 Tax=Hondaea fermentalgiana TaxID=2315210 RepID=A0A2R5GMC1_9STRA|nr:Hypothetical Protein FCC1311_082612 [Hondaea fermentalgiana]|eukprot:GBG32036.1 Hypothetical Protein FCC1311_082612 [Hondaea fermentalgiana]